jgi:hypothetical protein
LPLGQTARDDHAAELAATLEFEHLVDGAERFLTGRLDEAAGVHDREVGLGGVIDQLVAVQLEHAQHPLAVDEVLRTAQADEAVLTLRGFGADRRTTRRQFENR